MIDGERAEAELRRRRRQRWTKRAVRVGLVLWVATFFATLKWYEPAYAPKGLSFVEVTRDGLPRYMTPWAAALLYVSPFVWGVWMLINHMIERANTDLRWK